MVAFLRHLFTLVVLAAIIAGCSSRPAPVSPAVTATPAPESGAYVAPQSAPVRAPAYPALGGPVVQSGTGSIPLVQGS